MKLPKLNVFEKYDHVNPMKHLPRPQPSDFVADFFNHKENGFYIDVGAYDGVTCSNSVLLEQGYNWDGVCIEPNPTTFKELQRYRGNTLLNLGVSDVSEKLEFWEITGYPSQLSGFRKFFSDEHVNRIYSDIRNHGGELTPLYIDSCRLQDIISTHELPDFIDYLSIDCECADYNVLKGIDFDKTAITLISTESQESKNSDSEIESFLKERNYSRLTRVCNDIFYKKND